MIPDQYLELLKHCATTNTPEFNRNKAMEEATEFNDAVLKHQTKHPDNPKRPTLDDVVGEYGDFIYRGMIMLIMDFPDLTIDEIGFKIGSHIAMKLDKLQVYKDDGKYRDGL